MFLTQPLHKGRRERPQATAILSGDRRISFAELHERTARFGGLLRSLGVQPGDRVAMLALNSAEYLECIFGCWWVGAVVAPMNVRWSVPELAYGVEDSGARLLFVDAEHAAVAARLRAQCPQLGTVVQFGHGASADVAAAEELLARSAPVSDVLQGGVAPAALLYTGGTTGKSKGVMLSHDCLAIDVLATLEAGPRAPEPIALHCAPLFHIGGLGFTLQAIARLATQILLPGFDPARVLQLAQQERATEMFLVPTMIKRLIEHPDFPRHDLSSVRTLTYGAAPIDPALLDQAMAAFPQAGFIQVYGQTETGPVVSCLPPHCHLAGAGRDKLGSAGRPVATAEIRIVDDQGQELPVGAVGEICVRGPTLMLGYWNKPEQTAQTLREGWLHTGDGGYLDADGYLHVVDRIKDMIITGGENVFSTEVENALLQHPQVAQCGVIGVPDATWGERVHAVVVPRDAGAVDEAELIRFCKTLIAGYKCPRSVEFRSELPLSAAGKLLKYQLREPHWAGRVRSVA